MEEDNMENEPSNSVVVGTSQLVAPYLEKGIENFDIHPGTLRKKRKRQRSESSITLEEIKNHFGKTMDEAAVILNVSRSTLKHICRNRGIPRGKHLSPTRANLPDETIVASRVENVVIKATYQNNDIKFPFYILDGLVKLKELIATRLQLKHDNLRLKYRDEDGDMILILCDDDMSHEIVNTSEPTDAKAVIKLYVQLAGHQSSDA